MADREAQDEASRRQIAAQLEAIVSCGGDAALVGPAALALHAELQPSTTMLPEVIVRTSAADVRRAIEARLAELEPVEIRWLDDEAKQPALVADTRLVARLQRQPVRAWGLAVTADGAVHDPIGALPGIARGELELSRGPRGMLRGRNDGALRLAVWAAATGLTPSTEATRLAEREASRVLGLDRAQWCTLFGEVLVGHRPSAGLRFLHQARTLQIMLPEVVSMVDFHNSCPVHHKDIWDHTLQVVDKCPPSLVVRWSALMHDVGKVWTRSIGAGGKVHFFRHEEMSASLMEGAAARFHLGAETRDRVLYVIANHARVNVYGTEWTDGAVRRLIRDLGDHLEDVVTFSQCDFTTRRAWRIAEVRRLATELDERIAHIQAEDARPKVLPKGLGNLIMAATGLPGGPWLGRIQRWLEDEAEAGRIDAGLEADACLDHVRSHAPELLPSDESPAASSVSG